MTEEPEAPPIEETEQPTKIAIAPRFTREESDKIDKYRGERTKTEFVYDCVVAQLKVCLLLGTEKKKRSVVLKHDCGEKFDVLQSGENVFLICKKCHTSEKMTKATYNDTIAREAANQ